MNQDRATQSPPVTAGHPVADEQPASTCQSGTTLGQVGHAQVRYEELGRNYRFFSSWRHLTFAGGAAIWFGVIKVAAEKPLNPVLAMTAWAAMAGQVVLLLIDSRCHELITAAQKHGMQLERPAGGYYTAVDFPARGLSHTAIARWFYVSSALAFLWLALVKQPAHVPMGAVGVVLSIGFYFLGRRDGRRHNEAESRRKDWRWLRSIVKGIIKAALERLRRLWSRWGNRVERTDHDKKEDT